MYELEKTYSIKRNIRTENTMYLDIKYYVQFTRFSNKLGGSKVLIFVLGVKASQGARICLFTPTPPPTPLGLV